MPRVSVYGVLLLLLGLFGAGATLYLRSGLRPSEISGWDAFVVVRVITGGIAGVLSAHLLWIVARPRARVSRATAACVLANAVAWAAFVLFSPALSPAEFQQIRADRAQKDVEPGLMGASDQPVVVAARWHGTYGTINPADALVSLSANPAIHFATIVTVPARYGGLRGNTKRESYVIAGLAFLLSTAFWAAVGGAATAVMRRHRNRTARSAAA
jgi:hypothetical protein